jgi:hypothetical protein
VPVVFTLNSSSPNPLSGKMRMLRNVRFAYMVEGNLSGAGLETSKGVIYHLSKFRFVITMIRMLSEVFDDFRMFCQIAIYEFQQIE